MPRINIVAGDLSTGEWQLSGGILSGKKGDWGEPITIDLTNSVKAVDIQTEQQAKNFLVATGAGIGGAVAGATMTSLALLPWSILFPPLGAVALIGGAAGLIGGAMAGGNNKLLCVVVTLQDNRRFMAVVDQPLFQLLFSFIQAQQTTVHLPPIDRQTTGSSVPSVTAHSRNSVSPVFSNRVMNATSSGQKHSLTHQLETIKVQQDNIEEVLAIAGEALSNRLFRDAEKLYRDCLKIIYEKGIDEPNIDLQPVVAQLESALLAQGKNIDADLFSKDPRAFVMSDLGYGFQYFPPSTTDANSVQESAREKFSADFGIVWASCFVLLIIPVLCFLSLGNLALVLLLYFWPTLIALIKTKRNAGQIIVVNLLLGCTVIGWFLALVWAVNRDE